jgi:MoaD family protein
MRILFFATIRQCVGASEIKWDEATATLGELLEKLSVPYGPEFRRWVLDKNELGKTVIVVVNGQDARHVGGVETPLHPDDTIAIFPAIAGGSSRDFHPETPRAPRQIRPRSGISPSSTPLRKLAHWLEVAGSQVQTLAGFIHEADSSVVAAASPSPAVGRGDQKMAPPPRRGRHGWG